MVGLESRNTGLVLGSGDRVPQAETGLSRKGGCSDRLSGTGGAEPFGDNPIRENSQGALGLTWSWASRPGFPAFKGLQISRDELVRGWVERFP